MNHFTTEILEKSAQKLIYFVFQQICFLSFARRCDFNLPRVNLHFAMQYTQHNRITVRLNLYGYTNTGNGWGENNAAYSS